MTTWRNICRICTSPAEYEIFEKIPAYLHATSNEFLNWQKPINTLLEETTGLKFTTDDPLPNKICALCISYLKHAVIFREQCINNTLGLKAVGLLRQQNQKTKTGNPPVDKDSLLITAQELNFSDERQIDTNLLSNNCQQDQDKVCKQLLNNSFQATAPTQQNIEQQLRYLNLLFDKDTNAGFYHKRRNNPAGMGFETATGSGGDPYAEEDFQTATSSDENEDGALSQKHNIFSYSEKNFEEDDIMDVDELRNAITINIPESCKERKCRACFRRFMFEESFTEHMGACIEYKFLTYIEEMNRLLDIRRSKAISPHEFVRRMIFCLRKTCEWLKKANCGDMLLPDLVQNGSSAETKGKGRIESEGKSSAASSGEQKLPLAQTSNEKLRKRFDIPIKSDKLTDILLTTTPNENSSTDTTANLLLKNDDFNQNDGSCDYFRRPKPLRNDTATPISISNNILYEIERSQSRNSSIQSNFEEVNKSGQVKKPIALMATNSTTTTMTYTATFNGGNAPMDNTERLTFLQKLQQAASQTPIQTATPINNDRTMQHKTPVTPLINVRRDLLPQNAAYSTSDNHTPLTSAIPIKRTSLSFSARCNPCNILFETLAALEVHNAMYHNHLPTTPQSTKQPPTTSSLRNAEASEEHKRIIALFEDDDADTA